MTDVAVGFGSDTAWKDLAVNAHGQPEAGDARGVGGGPPDGEWNRGANLVLQRRGR